MSIPYESTQRFFRPNDVSRLRRNQRRIQAQRIIGALFNIVIVGMVLSIAAWLYLRAQSDSRFALKTIEITGAAHTPKVAMNDVMSAYRGTNLFRLDIANLQRDLGKLPWVSRVEIEKKLPATLHVNVVERTPAALVHDNDKLRYVDEHGVAFAELSPSIGDSDLPVITGAADGAELARAVAFVRDLRARDPQVFSRISEVRPVAPRGFALFDRELGAVVYANDADISQKYRDLYAIARAEQLDPRSIDYADLRFSDRIVIKPLHSITTAALPAPANVPAVQITN